jgi:hypothetical protein
MEKLRNLQSSAWETIDKQANRINDLILEFKKEGRNEVKIRGTIHKVNKAILEVNGFDVFQSDFDYHSCEPCFTIKW